MPELAHTFDRTTFAAQLRDNAQVALEQLRDAAHAGDVEAQVLHAQMHAEGRGVVRNTAEALYWYTLAASQGHAYAMNMVGRCHELGHGVAARAGIAAAWYRKAAQNGLDWGMYNLANLLATGRGVRADRAQAFAWYRRAAELGHAKSMNLVGRYFEEGWEVERDREAAHAWYRASAHAGDFRGQASHAAVLAESGRIDDALHWWREAMSGGTRTFLEHLGGQLLASQHLEVREIGASMQERARDMR